MDILIKYSKHKLFLIKFTISKPNKVQNQLFISLINFKDKVMF